MTIQNLEVNLNAVQMRMASACQRVERSREEVTLIAVTKSVDQKIIEDALVLGIRNFGENRVQEAKKKITALSFHQPRPSWHMLGHLQFNKIRVALSIFDILQSVDSVELAIAINNLSMKEVPVLLQVNISGEKTKFGFSLAEIEQAFTSICQLPRIKVKGLMTIAPLVKDAEQVRPIFCRLRKLKEAFHLEHLSMGMTNDFEVAIEEGATIVRIGRAIFGERY